LNSMRNKASRIRIAGMVLIAACCFSSYSCFTIKYSTTGANAPSEAKTASVQLFENQARNQEAGLTQKLTDDLRDYIQSNTSLILVNGTGDVDFEGAITMFDVKPAAIVSGDQAAKNRFTITVKVKFTCEVKPELNYETSFSRYEDYDASVSFESAKQQYTDDLMKLIIEDIFNKAFVNW
jgi:hypothetical protein